MAEAEFVEFNSDFRKISRLLHGSNSNWSPLPSRACQARGSYRSHIDWIQSTNSRSLWIRFDCCGHCQGIATSTKMLFVQTMHPWSLLAT